MVVHNRVLRFGSVHIASSYTTIIKGYMHPAAAATPAVVVKSVIISATRIIDQRDRRESQPIIGGLDAIIKAHWFGLTTIPEFTQVKSVSHD